MTIKIICLIICALMLLICYRAKGFAQKILKKTDDEITDKLILQIKIVTLVVSIIVFIFTMVFVR